MFRGNLAQWERVIRFILGFFLLTWVIAGGALWGYIGLPLLATACWGYCPVAALMGRRRGSARED